MSKNRISLWWKYEGQFIIPQLKKSIKSLKDWFPLVWKDRDHDYGFIYDVMEFKLAKQAAYLKSKNRFVSTERNVEIMELCVRLMQKSREEFYTMEYSDYHETEMDFKPTEDSKYFQLDMNEISENFQEYFDKYPATYRKVTKTNVYVFENSSKKNIAMNIGIYNQRRCDRLVFELMSRNIRRWWD